MKKRILLLLVCSIWSLTSYGQLNNDLLKHSYKLQAQDSSTLWMGLRVLGFNKNNEYENKVADSYTLFGYQFNPYLAYRAGKHVRVDVGVYAQQDFGNYDITTLQPTFSIKYKAGENYLIFGTLEDSYSHGLIEPLYDFEKGLNDRLEFGAQGIFKKEYWDLDAWISWENMIYPNDPEQEELIVGISSNLFLKKTEQSQFKIPIQMLTFHKGGEIDTNSGDVQTIVNVAAGMSLEKQLGGKISSLRMQHYYVGSRDFSETPAIAFEKGNALYLNASMTMKSGFEFQGSYWYGSGYVPIQGGSLYSSQSNSVRQVGYTEKNRELFILRLFYNKRIADGLQISCRFEPFYDLKNGKFEFSHGMYLTFTPEFFITKVKRVRY